MKADNYLLTGANGFLGKAIYRYLVKENFKVTGQQLFGTSRGIDISLLFELPESIICDVVVHSAGKAHSIPKSPEEEQVFYDVNFNGTKNLCRSLEKLPVKPKSFVFISTVSVYGLESGTLVSERTPLNGENAYAKSKRLAEEWLTEWAALNSIRLGILRIPLIAGPNPPGNLGDMIKAIERGKYLSIGKATSKKSMVLADDVAKVIPTLAVKGGIYNLTDGHHPSFKELETTISRQLNKQNPASVPLWFAKILAKAGDLSNGKLPINSDKLSKIISTLTFDDSLARKELNWDPKPVLSNWSIK